MGRVVVVVLSLLWGGTLQGQETPRSLRTWEIVRRDCRTTQARQEVTLFGSGTLRLRERSEDSDEMRLAELDPDEVQAYVRRLEAEDLSEVPQGRDEVLGAFVERCAIYLELPERPPQRYFFGRFDSLPLGLSRLNAIINDMYEEANDLAPEGGLPRYYIPEPGDVLERTDGRRFQVVALTSDRKGVELSGLDDPLTIFVAIEALREQFVGLVDRRDFP